MYPTCIHVRTLRKPVLPVEVDLLKVDTQSESGEAEHEWDATDVVECAKKMMGLKKKIYEKAMSNILMTNK